MSERTEEQLVESEMRPGQWESVRLLREDRDYLLAETKRLTALLVEREAAIEDWKGACLTFASDAYSEGHYIGQGETRCEVHQMTKFAATETAKRIQAALTTTGE